MTTIKIFNPNDLPFGSLSNNAHTPFRLDGKYWNSVTHYIYGNMLRRGDRDFINRTPVRNVIQKYEEFRNKYMEDITVKILENGISALIAFNPEFKELLLSTGTKNLIYRTDNQLFGQNDEGDGENLLGKVYEKIRKELQSKKRVERSEQLQIEEDEKLTNIIYLTKILKDKLLNGLDDLSSLVDLSYADLFDSFSEDISHLTYPAHLILEQYKQNRSRNMPLLQRIVNDPENIIYYIRREYTEEFKSLLFIRKRRELIEYFLKEILKHSYGNKLSTPEQLDKELQGQINKLVKEKGIKHVESLYNRIIKLFDDGKIEIPLSISEKYKNTIDENIKKSPKLSIDDLKTELDIIGDEPVRPSPQSATLGDLKDSKSHVDEESGIENPEEKLLQSISNKEKSDLINELGGKHSDYKTEETAEYIMFTDNLSKYQRLSPFFTGPFSSEAFYYPCLAGFYFSKLIYTLGNMVETLTATMAHKFIMIPKCQPRKVTCDKFNLIIIYLITLNFLK